VRDDISKLPLPKAAKRYARMTSKQLGQNWSRKVDLYLDMAASVTNQSKEGFRNRDAAGKVPHAMKGIGEASSASLQKAAQAWCTPRTSNRIMDPELATAFADILDALAMNVVEDLLDEGLFRSEGDYYYATCCVGSTAEKIHAMVDAGHEVSKTEFFKNVPLKEVFNSGIAGIYAWTPKQCRAAGVDYEEVRQNRGGLKMWNDWAIGYYKSVYDGQECYYFDHSRIEYIFCKYAE
jgi:hypothetical protein